MPDVRKMLDAMPTGSTLEAFDNERYFGIVVRFVETGFGFGEITFSVNKETGAVHYDPEEMSPKHCAELLMRTVGTTVVDGNPSAESTRVIPLLRRETMSGELADEASEAWDYDEPITEEQPANKPAGHPSGASPLPTPIAWSIESTKGPSQNGQVFWSADYANGEPQARLNAEMEAERANRESPELAWSAFSLSRWPSLDASKPKPDLCQGCGETADFCVCSHGPADPETPTP